MPASASVGEEIANSVRHGAGAAAAMLTAPFLVATAARRGGPLWVRIPVTGWLWLRRRRSRVTAGVAFYACDHRERYGHFVWHAFVPLPSDPIRPPAGRLGPGYYAWLAAGILMSVAALRGRR